MKIIILYLNLIIGEQVLKNIFLMSILYFNTALAMEADFTNVEVRLEYLFTLVKRAYGDVCEDCLEQQNVSDSEEAGCSNCSENSDVHFVNCYQIIIYRRTMQQLN